MDADDAVVLQASVNQPALFEVIFERHHVPIWGYLARRGGRERADDLAGDVFVSAFARRADYDPSRGSVRSWLYGIAANRLRMRLRTDARALSAFRRAAAQQAVDVAHSDGADHALDCQSHLSLVIDALARLSSTDREILTLFAWEHLSYEEIAAVTGVEVGTVRSRLSRARRRLRELLGASGKTTDEVGA